WLPCSRTWVMSPSLSARASTILRGDLPRKGVLGIVSTPSLHRGRSADRQILGRPLLLYTRWGCGGSLLFPPCSHAVGRRRRHRRKARAFLSGDLGTTRLMVGKPLALCPAQECVAPLRVGHAAGVPAEIELCEVPVQVRFGQVVERAVD